MTTSMRTKALAEIKALALNTGRPAPKIEIHAWGDLLWAHGAAALALAQVTETLLGPVARPGGAVIAGLRTGFDPDR
jgi:hypothetical protein